MGFKYLDAREIPDRFPGEVWLFAVLRNESERLPYFLEHYRRIGVTRFIFLLNHSDDQENPIFNQPDIHRFVSLSNFSRVATQEINQLCRKFSKNAWSVVVDADELFVLPTRFSDVVSLTLDLDRKRKQALSALLLDLYPARIIAPTLSPKIKKLDKRPLQHLFFDAISYPFFEPSGGMRQRVFGLDGVSLQKYPLIKFNSGVRFGWGTHMVSGGTVTKDRVVLLHNKYDVGFIPRVQEEVVRQQHWHGAREYKRYLTWIQCRENSDLKLFSPDVSRRFTDITQLESLSLSTY